MHSDISLEYLISDFSVFEKATMIRRLSDIMHKVVDPANIVFPKNTMLHMFDNFSHSDATTDDFDITKYPFLNTRMNIKYLHNFANVNTISEELLSKFSHRLYRSKLAENLRAFNIANRKFLIPSLNLDTVIENKNCIIVENYNPLYRILSTSARPINQYYRYQMILATALQNLLKYDRQHFLVIPVESEFTINRSNIMAIAQSGTISSQRLISTSHFYFFIIDFALTLLDNQSSISTLSSISPKELSKINVMFIHKNKSIVFNFGRIASIITTKPYLFHFLNTISSLSGVENITLDEIENIKDVENVEIESEQREEDIVKYDYSEVTELTQQELNVYYMNKKSLMNNFKSLQREKYSFAGYGIYQVNHLSNKLLLIASCILVTDFKATTFSSTYFAEDEIIKILENVYTDQYVDQLKSVISYILNKYTDTIFIKLDKSNKADIAFYKEFGFQVTDIHPNDAESVILGIRFVHRIQEKVIPKKDVYVSSKRSYLIPQINKYDDRLKTITDRMTLSDKQKDRIVALSEKYNDIKVTINGEEKFLKEVVEEKIDTAIKPEDLSIRNDAGIEESYKVSCTHVFDTNYREKLLHTDILKNIISFRENGLFLTNYSEQDDYTSFNRVKYVKAVFTDVRNKQHILPFKLPMPDSEGYYLVNGVRMTMTKQLVNVPICKISPTRVSLISDYIKTLVDKVTSVRQSPTKFLAKQAENLGITLVPKMNNYIGISAPYEYKLFGHSYSKIATKEYVFFFEYKDRFKFFIQIGQAAQESLEENVGFLENQYGTLIGKVLHEDDVFIFMNMKNELTAVNVNTFNKVEIPKYILECFGDFQTPAEWCNLKILDKNIPIGFILCYRYGISKVLNNMKIDYHFVEKNTRQKVRRNNTDVVIEFRDGYLVFNRYPLLHSYIMSGLLLYSTLSNYKFIDLDGKDAYYGLLSEKGMSINYLKGIDNYFNFFVDPITKSVLEEMGEPTNTRDLLIRSVDMLVNSDDKEPSSISNFRVRSAEKIPAMIYNEISRQYANYINSEFKDVSFSINTEAIFQRLIQDETMGLRENINPIHVVEYKSRVTHSGFGGRSSQAFVSRDRKYAKDAVGVISEATTDSGSVGMVAFLSSDPNISNLRGMFHEEKETKTSNVLSEVSLLMPGSVHDDQHGPTNQ